MSSYTKSQREEYEERRLPDLRAFHSPPHIRHCSSHPNQNLYVNQAYNQAIVESSSTNSTQVETQLTFFSEERLGTVVTLDSYRKKPKTRIEAGGIAKSPSAPCKQLVVEETHK